jgi:hypothetical protein
MDQGAMGTAKVNVVRIYMPGTGTKFGPSSSSANKEEDRILYFNSFSDESFCPLFIFI